MAHGPDISTRERHLEKYATDCPGVFIFEKPWEEVLVKLEWVEHGSPSIEIFASAEPLPDLVR